LRFLLRQATVIVTGIQLCQIWDLTAAALSNREVPATVNLSYRLLEAPEGISYQTKRRFCKALPLDMFLFNLLLPSCLLFLSKILALGPCWLLRTNCCLG
jgi:hypothetical protein